MVRQGLGFGGACASLALVALEVRSCCAARRQAAGGAAAAAYRAVPSAPQAGPSGDHAL